ncbi:MAG TPA: hypothetical protein VNJ08_05585 [Bacteriovoracaceae bacterium]|nr:hypothetical protein [Bacteriovoracaceae bacterium]
MTLSNFDWTDKTSVRWFIMLPTGHEGPYDLISIKQRCGRSAFGHEVKIWAEGLKQPVAARIAFEKADALPPEEISAPVVEPVSMAHHLAAAMSEDIPPIPEDDIPPLPFEAYASAAEEPRIVRNKSGYYAFFAMLVSGLFLFFIIQWIKGNEGFSIRRHARMSLELHQRIENELSFKGWNEKIFFKEYVPADISQIWLVTSSFHECEVEANFNSIKGKLLTVKDDPISFRSRGHLQNHVVELSSFDFKSGNKIIPGMYELDIKATNCKWTSMSARLANFFRPMDDDYVGRMKVILYPKGAAEFNEVLNILVKKKSDNELKKKNREELYWQDLQQKFQTLLALSLQIEQHLLDFLGDDPKVFRQNLKPTVDFYTKKFGHFLTSFVTTNEAYFAQLGEMESRSQKRNYELMIKSTSKKIGFESMKLIEELQKMKNPKKGQLNTFSTRLKKTFADLKSDINQKIIQISDDRSL